MSKIYMVYCNSRCLHQTVSGEIKQLKAKAVKIAKKKYEHGYISLLEVDTNVYHASIINF